MPRSVPILLFAAAALTAGLTGCEAPPPAADSASPTGSPPAGGGGDLFIDLGAEAGFDFRHFNGMTGELLFPEMMGGGGALLDYDGDGDLDLYLAQGGGPGSGGGTRDALFPPRHPTPLTDRLYRNEAAGDRLRLVDVTEGARLPPAEQGMGVTAGDFDGDGFVDLYVTAFGANRLLRNGGDGTFSDVTAASGTGDERWSVPAVFFDYDRDGRLDLYVGNYLDYTLGTHKDCFDAAGALDYCGPAAYGAVTDRLFHNRGGGRFADVSLRSGIGAAPGKTLGAVAADFDGDGWLDLYVANDGERNFLWINQGDGTFRDEALVAGCALNRDGMPQASMGVAAGDFDNDGDPDLFMTHLTAETNALFRNEGEGVFTDATDGSGLGLPSWSFTGFGMGWIDVDRDGWLDLLTVNGAVHVIPELAQAGDPYPLHQRKQLFRNRGDGTFEEVGERAGDLFRLSEVGRGVAFGDVDGDGGEDVMVVNNNGPARLLGGRPGGGEWIGLRLGDGLRGANGAARVEVRRADGFVLRRQTAHGGSYAAAGDPRLLIGLGEAGGAVDLLVEDGAGRRRLWRSLPPGRYYALSEPGGGA